MVARAVYKWDTKIIFKLQICVQVLWLGPFPIISVYVHNRIKGNNVMKLNKFRTLQCHYCTYQSYIDKSQYWDISPTALQSKWSLHILLDLYESNSSWRAMDGRHSGVKANQAQIVQSSMSAVEDGCYTYWLSLVTMSANDFFPLAHPSSSPFVYQSITLFWCWWYLKK